jgi:alkanesulfonate monooxygenase SsuD/methylene tetrahydromethanopterin reductase-like flavin-dependent oxidoreductase (luciferase family)
VDHLFWPQPTLECLTTLAVAATATRRATLGTCVLQLPLRRPAAVAKQAAALQLLSGGRFVLGLGVGSHRGEYEQAGVDFSGRGRLMDEAMAEVRRAWSSAAEPDLDYRQEPAGPPVPVWVGGSSPAAGRRAAEADGWVPMFVTAPDYARGLANVRARAAAAGRDEGAVTAAVVAVVRVGGAEAQVRGAECLSALYGIAPKAFERHLVAGGAEHCAERLAEYRGAGAEHVAVMVADDHPLEPFAELAAAVAAAPAPSAHGRRGDPVEARA